MGVFYIDGSMCLARQAAANSVHSTRYAARCAGLVQLRLLAPALALVLAAGTLRVLACGRCCLPSSHARLLVQLWLLAPVLAERDCWYTSGPGVRHYAEAGTVLAPGSSLLDCWYTTGPGA